jgi:CRISPR-associated protein Cas2
MRDIKLSFANKDACILSYDISNDKLRRKIEKTLKNFGMRVQYSVFYCDTDSEQSARIADSVRRIASRYPELVSNEDSILVLGGVEENKIKFLLGTASVSNGYMLY